MPREHIQLESCATFYGVTYIVPIVGDTDGLLAITQRSYTYLLRNANPYLLPSQFRRHTTVDKVFRYMIARLRKGRNINSEQVKIYGVENFLALLTHVEKKWKICASWSTSLILELPFQFPLNYHDIVPREKGSNWSFDFISATGQRTRYVLPVLKIVEASVQGREWAAKFSRANPRLGGIVSAELLRAAFENYICHIVPKPGSIMRKIFFEQFDQQLGEPYASLLKANPESKEKCVNKSASSEKVPEAEEQTENKSDDDSDDNFADVSDNESEDRSNYRNNNEPSSAKDGSQPEFKGEGAFKEVSPGTAREASDQACCTVEMEVTCFPGNFIKVPQIFDPSNIAEAKITLASRSSSESKVAKRTRSPSGKVLSVEDQNVMADESKVRLEGSPKHKRLKMRDNPGTGSDNDMEASAISPPQSYHGEVCISEPGTDAKLGFERVSSLDSKIEDNSTSKTGIGSEAESDKKPALFNPSRPSSYSGQDLCSVESSTHTSNSTSLSISKVNDNAAISKSELPARPDSSTVKIHDEQLIEPKIENLVLPVLASQNSTSLGPLPAEICTVPDMLNELERYLDGLDAIAIRHPVGDHT